MKVKILNNHTGDFKSRLTCTWTLDVDGTAICDDPIDQKNMETFGAVSGGKTYYPRDGEAFLRALPIEFSSSTWTDAVLEE